ncbi:exonuclease subunit SbcD [Colwellia sp. MB3u-70]|uniref:exonuclease subunit SbcD n=1 Tax=unclassified Colwellia TaxID=196834 RepID=UPI0015F543DA|nr:MULTISPECIES: exonuclease subunit SbcD [unclassified Colwellia]MBA6291134.1 exonuclease subunit SbcD [Colwellia sp. MB3u-8]MBA6305636.1 exonuclease subunit SbcD [Colwellia sp. MB3u-70]
MRIIHTSDWHLGQHFYGKSRAPEHQQFLNWLIEQSKSQQIDAIIVAGDIFDTGTPPSYAREMYFDFIAKLHQTHCQLVVLAGNHDSVAMLTESQKILQQLSTRVISAVSNNMAEQVFVLNSLKTEQQAVICAIPFIRPRDIVKSYAGQSANEKQRSLQQAITEHYQGLFEQAQGLSQLNQADGTRLPIIATGHLTTIGASTSESVRDIYIGTLEAFPASEFPAADYIALGHIHRPQKVTKSEHIRYSGSPIALSFDEANTQKSIVIAQFKAGELSNVELCKVPCFQPLAMVKTHLETLTEDISAVVESKTLESKNAESENTDLKNIGSQNSQAEKQDKIWLDIEIESAEYLLDLSARIEQIVKEMPVEVLLVRRSKKARQQMPSHEKKVTLSELSVQEVFDARMALEPWDSDEQQQRKTRLNSLYLTIAEQTQRANSSKQSLSEHSEAHSGSTSKTEQK